MSEPTRYLPESEIVKRIDLVGQEIARLESQIVALQAEREVYRSLRAATRTLTIPHARLAPEQPIARSTFGPAVTGQPVRGGLEEVAVVPTAEEWEGPEDRDAEWDSLTEYQQAKLLLLTTSLSCRMHYTAIDTLEKRGLIEPSGRLDAVLSELGWELMRHVSLQTARANGR
jgi:hypothetical protein